MGVMIDGIYHTDDPGPDTTEGGEFKRAAAKIRDWITPDGPFTPDPGRYRLYVAWNCPWAHRALLARAILGIGDPGSASLMLARAVRIRAGSMMPRANMPTPNLASGRCTKSIPASAPAIPGV